MGDAVVDGEPQVGDLVPAAGTGEHLRGAGAGAVISGSAPEMWKNGDAHTETPGGSTDASIPSWAARHGGLQRDDVGVMDEVAVRQRGALRPAGRAAGEQDQERVVLVDGQVE